MKLQVQIAEDQWFCLGWIIEKNDHPKLTPYTSERANHTGKAHPHYSFREALTHCLDNPHLDIEITLLDFNIGYKKPKVKEGSYYGVRWYYSEAFNCYACELSGAETIPFKSQAEVKRYIKDWYKTVGYDE